jgi:hypothetical protein
MQRMRSKSFRYFATLPSARATLLGDTHVLTSILAMIWPADAFKIAIASGEATNQEINTQLLAPHSHTLKNMIKSRFILGSISLMDQVLLNYDDNNISWTVFWSSSVLEFIIFVAIVAVRWNARNVNHLQVRCECASDGIMEKSCSAACMSGLESIGKSSRGKMDTSFSLGSIS